MAAHKDSTSTASLSVATAGSPPRQKALSTAMAGYIIIAQLSGAGFLALPRALADTGWLGAVMLVLFGVSVAFVGTRLGQCWVILEERWPETYRGAVRQPYMDIAERSMGSAGRKMTLWALLFNVCGSGIVFMTLLADMMASVIQYKTGFCLTTCHVILIVGACWIPLTWLGTPKDFWPLSLLAVGATVVAVVVIVVQVFVSADTFDSPAYPNPTVPSFARGFGTFLFACGGVSVFPTIQNDMKDRSHFWKSIIIGYSGILSLYLPTALVGYIMIGNAVQDNILLSVPMTNAVIAAICMEIINLMFTYLIGANTVFQAVEEMLNVPNRFGPGRCAVRTAILMSQMLIGLAVPNFGVVLNLIGGSLITLCTFVLPPVMYMRLVYDRSNNAWPQRTIPLWEKIYLVEIAIVGVIGGVLSTITGVYDVIEASFESNCFKDFSKCFDI